MTLLSLLEISVETKDMTAIQSIVKTSTDMAKKMAQIIYQPSNLLNSLSIYPSETFVEINVCHICRKKLPDSDSNLLFVSMNWMPHPRGVIYHCNSPFCGMVASYSIIKLTLEYNNKIRIIPFRWLGNVLSELYSDKNEYFLEKIRIPRSNGEIVEGRIDWTNYSHFLIEDNNILCHVYWKEDSQEENWYYHKWISVQTLFKQNDELKLKYLKKMLTILKSMEFENSICFTDRQLEEVSQLIT